MQLRQLTSYLETIAPPSYQESYDNAGLIVGNPKMEVTGALLCLDSTEEIIEEALALNCNVIIAHHPIVFRGLKTFTGKNYVERVVMDAIRYDIAIYAIHTNLDNVYHQGVNAKFAEKLGLVNTKILAPKKTLKKLQTYVPADISDRVRNALFAAGAGQIPGFKNLSHTSLGVGSKDDQGTAEVKLELVFASPLKGKIIGALLNNQGDQQIPYEISDIENSNVEVGAGMIGELSKPEYEKPFLQFVKKTMRTGCIRHTRLRSRKIHKVALCGGAGGFLLAQAKAQGADVFITADYKYHEFFDADGEILIADIGHYESEQYTIELLYDLISAKFSTFAVYSTEVNTNPVKYL